MQWKLLLENILSSHPTTTYNLPYSHFKIWVCLNLFPLRKNRQVDKPHGRRRLLKSGPAMKGQRRSRVPNARVGGEHERGHSPSRKGVSGDLPEKILYCRTSVETILMHFETIFETL